MPRIYSEDNINRITHTHVCVCKRNRVIKRITRLINFGEIAPHWHEQRQTAKIFAGRRVKETNYRPNVCRGINAGVADLHKPIDWDQCRSIRPYML